MKVSNLELNVDPADSKGRPRGCNNSVEQQPPPESRASRRVPDHHAPPFNYCALNGHEYDLDYVKNRVSNLPNKAGGGESMLTRPPKQAENLETLYSWSVPDGPRKGSSAGPRPRTEAALPSSSASLPSLASPERAATAAAPGHQRGAAESGNVRQFVNGYNLRGVGGTWQSVAKNEWDVDRPAMRADADGLAYGFMLAMAIVEGDRDGMASRHSSAQSRGGGRAASAGGGGGNNINNQNNQNNKDEALKSSLENDFLAIKAQVSHSVDERQTLRDLVDGIMNQTGSLRSMGLEAHSLRKDAATALGLSPAAWTDIKDAMASCVYEQKWTDLTFQQLCNQVSVSCRQHGDLMLVLRSRYANLCNKVSKMYSDSLWQLDRAAQALIEAKEELHRSRQEWDAKHQALEVEVQRLKGEMEVQEAAQVEKREVIQQESRDQVRKMGDTLRTLNGIFRNMQTDVEAMRAADLKDQIETLRSDLHDKVAELTELRPIAETVHLAQARLKHCEEKLEAAKQAEARMADELQQREALIQELMIHKTELIADKDKLLNEVAKADSKQQQLMQQAKEGEEAASEAKRAVVPTSILCARCNQSLDSAVRLDELHENRNRQQCYAFRLMIPNNAGRVPERTIKWTRQCMRAITYAKMIEMASLGSTQLQPLTRFPEFLYAWFEPSRARMESVARDERAALLEQANDNRWGLYYRVKALARESAEARLFWSLLDETYGSDYQAFYLYAFNLVENVAGLSLRRQWGRSVCKGSDHDTLERFVAEEDANSLPPLDPSSVSTIQLRAAHVDQCNGGQEAIWVELVHIKTATDIILSKAPKEVSVKVWEAIKSVAVTSDNRVPPVPDRIGDEECVDLYLWLKLIMQNFRQDQINRRAAIKLMFTTSLTGVMTNELDYDPARPRMRSREEDDKNPKLNLPQTLAVVRTLWPHMSTTESVAFYREIHDSSGGRVDFEHFIKVSERLQFFTRSLVLPSLVLAKVDRRLDRREHVELDALVHLHYTAMSPYYSKLKAMLPDQARARFESAEHDLVKLVEMRRKGVASDVDGLCPLFAYRRMLLLAHHFRAIKYEEDADFTGLLTPVKFGGSKLVSVVRQELSLMERALLDDREDQFFVLYQELRRKMAAIRIQASWRRKIKDATYSGVPLGLVGYMRRGYSVGRGGLRSRRQNIHPTQIQSIVGEIFRSKIEMDRHMTHLGQAPLPFKHIVYLFFLNNYGCRSVAERCLHDFFHNARKMVVNVLRVRLFGLFVGMVEGEKDIKHSALLQTEEAVDFYLRGLMLLRAQLEPAPAPPTTTRPTGAGAAAAESGATEESAAHPHAEDQQSTAQESTAGQSMASRRALFPASYTDNRGRKVWEMPTPVLIAVSTTLFKPLLGSNTSTADFLDFLEDVKALDNRKLIDVDDYMWAAMKFWSHVVHARFSKAKSVVSSSSVSPVKHVLSFSNFRKLEGDVGGPYPESLNPAQQDLLTLLAYYKANETLDRSPKRDAVEVVLTALRKRLFIDMWEPVQERCKVELLRSRSYEVNQLSHDWNSYELPLRAYVNAVTTRRSSNVPLAPSAFSSTLNRSGVSGVLGGTLQLSSSMQLPSALSSTLGSTDTISGAAMRRQSRVIEAAAEAGRRNSSLGGTGGLSRNLNMGPVLQLQNLLLELEQEINKAENAVATAAPNEAQPGAAGGGAVDDPDDLTLESALEKLMSAQAGGKAKDPWKLLREAIATMNDILVSASDYDIRTEFLQDVEPSALGKLSFASH